MKRIILATLSVMTFAGAAHAGSIRVENGDSRDHTIELKCSGSSKTVEVRASTTATYTFHSTSNSCDIVGGSVAFPTAKLENNQHWKFKDGKARPN